MAGVIRIVIPDRADLMRTLKRPMQAAADKAVAIIRERTARGLAEVSLDGQLVNKAHEWAAVMAGSGVRHSTLTDGAGDNWTILGENVGRASTVAEMNRLFMASSHSLYALHVNTRGAVA